MNEALRRSIDESLLPVRLGSPRVPCCDRALPMPGTRSQISSTYSRTTTQDMFSVRMEMRRQSLQTLIVLLPKEPDLPGIIAMHRSALLRGNRSSPASYRTLREL